MPGSKKAVDECFAAIHDVLPHAIELIRDEKSKTEKTHNEIQNCKSVNKVAPIVTDKKEMIKSPVKQENVPVKQENVPIEPIIITPKISRPNPSISKEVTILSEDFQATVMSEIIIDDSHDILNISSSKIQASEKRRSMIEDDLELKPPSPKHVCPHKTAKAGDESDRNSIYPMVEVENALEIIYSKIIRSK